MKTKRFNDSRRRLIRHGIDTGGALLATAAFSKTLMAAPTEPSHAGPANETLKTIHSLRTIHGDFSDKAVPDETIQLIISASVRAANASAMQSYSIIVVKDGATIDKLTGYRGSCLLLYCLDYTRVFDSAAHLGYRFQGANMESFVTGSTNTILAAQTAVIAAKSLGVDSLLTNGIHRGDMQRVWDIAGLPEQYCFPLIALILGYAAKEPAYMKGRLSGPGVIHFGQYHRLSKTELDEIVRQYDDKSRHLGLVEDWDQRGHKHYQDWLYKDWLRVPSAQGPQSAPTESQISKFMRKNGFVEEQKS
jgi:nitroreductase